MASNEMVIFTRTFDLLVWVMSRAERFPRSQRFYITKRLINTLLDFQETLYLANAYSGRERLSYLRRADAQLNILRLYLRLAQRNQWLTDGQYQHVSLMVSEVGRLLGGWVRQTRQTGRAGGDLPPQGPPTL